MKRIIGVMLLIVVMSISLAGCAFHGGQVVNLDGKETLSRDLATGGYSLVFEDEFDGELDTTIWRIGNDHTVRRAAYYPNDNSNVFTKDGNLIIRTNYQKDGALGAGWYTGWVECSSPTVWNNGPEYKGFPTQYGYYECRCICPPAEGIWSAFWMMPDRGLGAKGMFDQDEIGTGHDGVEVDVMESPYYQMERDRDVVTPVIHSDGYRDHHNVDQGELYRVHNMYKDFHRYGVMWTPEEYIFYIDGVETYRTKNMADGKELGVSQVPEYMILSVEVAGFNKDGKMYPGKEEVNGKIVKHWAGNPNANSKSENYDFVIDYVRVYQIAD